MKRIYLLGISYWVLSILVKSIILMQAWNLIVVKLFAINNITYLMSLTIVLLLSLFTSKGHFHKKHCYIFRYN